MADLRALCAASSPPLQSAPGTSTATHLASRNLMAGLGPLTAATISQKVGSLQYALLLTPLCYVLGSVLFWKGERMLADKAKAEKAAERAKKEAAASLQEAQRALREAESGEGGGAEAGALAGLLGLPSTTLSGVPPPGGAAAAAASDERSSATGSKSPSRR